MKNKFRVLISIGLILIAMTCYADNKSVLNKKQAATTVDFFYYGPGADEDVMTAIIGKKPLNARPAILQGYKLGVQGVNDIPDIKVNGSNLTAREIIKTSWGPDFIMHAAYKGNGQIKGIVWTINKDDLDAVKDWELVSFKWYNIVDGKVIFPNGKTEKVLTIAVKDQKIRYDIDGLNYDLFLDKGQQFKELFLRKVAEARKEYLARISNNH